MLCSSRKSLVMKFNILICISLFSLAFISCSDDTTVSLEEMEGVMPIGMEVEDDIDNIENPGNIQEVTTLPRTVNYPFDNPYSQAKEDLGRLLFWDPVLSGNLEISCASCHHPDHAYADGLERSVGVNGNLIDRNSPTIINTAYNGIELTNNYDPERAPMFWDNRTLSLEGQSIEPILSAVEMRGNQISEDDIVDVVIERLEAIPEYVSMFDIAFGTTNISEQRIADALATFERSIVANNSRFDQYMRGDEGALTQREIAGLNNFIDVGCADCHSGAMFSDFELHTLSTPNNGVNDNGATGDFDFRTPSLRNVALTAPYMHNGVFDSLEDVLDFYDDISRGNGNSQNNNVADNQIANDARNLNLNNNQINNIIQFLETLTDTNFDRTIPTSVPSDLEVGGNL
jgi:cytochrome c peroxidase